MFISIVAFAIAALLCVAMLLSHWHLGWRMLARRRLAHRPAFERLDWIASEFPCFQLHCEAGRIAWATASIVAQLVGVEPGKLRAADKIIGDYTASLMPWLVEDPVWEGLTSQLAHYVESESGRAMTNDEYMISKKWVTLNDVVQTTIDTIQLGSSPANGNQ
jgi:hypothetical protein